MKKIGVLTSGGDASGMNPAIRAAVRTALGRNLEIMGIQRGYRGLYENDFITLNSHSVSGIIAQGGTILKSIRFPKFNEPDALTRAHANLKNNGVEGLVVIGGDGSARGAHALMKKFDFPVVHIPASIDNDIYGTDVTVGFDTAVNTAVDAIDKIRDTATSHERTFIVEVMGRERGNLALEIAVACGAEIVLIPEQKTDWEKTARALEENARKGKTSSIIILAEGAAKAHDAADILQKLCPDREIRFSVLGYIQRGGKPTYATRVLATRFGVEAVNMLCDGKYGCMVGMDCSRLVHIPLEEVAAKRKPSPLENLDTVRLMSV